MSDLCYHNRMSLARYRVLALLQQIAGEDAPEFKTEAHYDHALRGYIRDLYERGDEGLYLDRHSRLIEQQFERAWKQGLKLAGMTWDEQTDDELNYLVQAIRDEQNRTLGFALEILEARESGKPVSPFYARVPLWAKRYTQTVNQALAMAKTNPKLEWQLGATEKHCRTCLKLNGRVKRASFWSQTVLPQGGPNPKLECQGWECDCKLVVSKKPLSKGPLPSLP